MSPGNHEPMRIAVVDVDSGFTTVLNNRIETAGWHSRLLTVMPPLEELVAMRAHALVMDPATLGPQSWEVIERTAGMMPTLGLLVCSSDSTVAQRVRGLRLGVDDWIAKPCHPEEVIARIEAVVRRRRPTTGTELGPLVVGELEIRPDRYQAFVGATPIDLTRREFELLVLLANADGQVMQREEIYQRVWGYAMARGDRSVDVFVKRIRSKVASMSPGWDYIHTHFGIGYRFSAEPHVEQGSDTQADQALVTPARTDDVSPPSAVIAVPAVVNR